MPKLPAPISRGFSCACRPVGVSMISMRLVTAHRILIAASVVFFLGFSIWQLSRYFVSGDGWGLIQGIIYFLVAGGFAMYFVNIKKWYG